ARRAALDAEIRPERRLADTDHRLLADAVETVAEPHRGRRLALACRRRVDRGHQDQLAVAVALHLLDVFSRDLRLVVPVGKKMLGGYPELSTDFHDRLLLRRARDLDIGLEFGHLLLPRGLDCLSTRQRRRCWAHQNGSLPPAPS